MHSPPKLRVVATSIAGSGSEPREKRGFEAPSPTARPSERCEPWPVEADQELESFAAATREAQIPLGLAVIVVVERALAGEDLDARGLSTLAAELDQQAVEARVTVELSAAQSAYLGALSGRDATTKRALPRFVVLPMRLTERLCPEGPVPRLEPSLLASALAWERAAAVAGRTMSEWAALKALELQL
jgi:hypothetical protein